LAALDSSRILSVSHKHPDAGSNQELNMHTYVIERNMPGAGRLSAAELAAASKVSNEALATLADRVKWGHSYVTEDKVFCVYMADDPDAIREHARLAGLPADEIHQVGIVIDPRTGKES
jgi:hypothetical protein